MRRLGTVLAVSVLVVTGCATMRVGSYTGRGIDFTPYLTYDWGPADALPTGDPRLDNNAFFRDHLEGSVERQMAARGYARAASHPDLLIHYHATIERRLDVDSIDRQYNNCYEDGCLPRVVAYDAGTLVVDIVDARTNELIWRGWARDSMEGVLDDQDRLEQQVSEAVSRMFQQLPIRTPASVRGHDTRQRAPGL
jgi:hypothetical protein